MQSLEVSDRTRLRMERLRVAELEQQRSEEEAVAVLVVLAIRPVAPSRSLTFCLAHTVRIQVGQDGVL